MRSTAALAVLATSLLAGCTHVEVVASVPPRYPCPTVADDEWLGRTLAGVHGSPLPADVDRRGRAYVRAAAYCRASEGHLR